MDGLKTSLIIFTSTVWLKNVFVFSVILKRFVTLDLVDGEVFIAPYRLKAV